MEKYSIRATWAVLGQAFKPEDDFQKGRSIVQDIRDCRIPQEIGCHTFSHIRANSPTCSKELFESELNKCQTASKNAGFEFESFVFPWNSVGYLDSLKKFGYSSYRGNSGDWYEGMPPNASRIAHLLDHWLMIKSPVVYGLNEQGIWNLPASYFYASGAGWGKLIPIQLRVWKVKQGLRLAAGKRGQFHIWFHPFDFAADPKWWLQGLESIFIEVNRYREEGSLENLTMGELADKLKNTKR
jgi:peptidoglycan/xylan/chitin deacetylase (PgdA/CDA1 family)